ncbi:restriction endonuclease subunit S [uncultured Microbacterium sp.]|uniref:restriction endonuclease subunit S n=1 Tax=uncultured Microbacterium sp. TaxID=191216 RepID=UPI0026055DAD|nr:restriction endonuclease subunit S [uncultured Microbacterium sp.]
MSEWSTQPLSEVIELQRGHDLPSSERADGSVPIIGSFGVTGYHDRAMYEGPGVAIGRSGASIGQATFVVADYWPLNTCLFVRDFKGNNPYWIYRLLDSIDFTAFNSGSAQPSLNRNFLRSIPVALPPLPEQQAIAEVLGALDDKIAANTRLAATADEFVRALVALSDCTDSIPLSKLFTSPRIGVDPTQIEPTTPYVGLEHVPRRSMWLSEAGIAQDASSTKSAFEAGDLLFGKLRPYFHKVVTAPFSGICSTDILVLRPRDADLSGFASAAAASDAVIASVTASSEGTRMPRASWRDLAAVDVPWPGHSAATRISEEIASIRDTVHAGLAENRTLAATRDALLPKLMSGQLRVKNAEKILSEVGV